MFIKVQHGLIAECDSLHLCVQFVLQLHCGLLLLAFLSHDMLLHQLPLNFSTKERQARIRQHSFTFRQLVIGVIHHHHHSSKKKITVACLNFLLGREVKVWDPEKPDNARLAAALATSGNLPVTAWPVADTVLIP